MTDTAPDRATRLALLDGLLVGAGELIESAEEWAARLAGGDPGSLAGRFVVQLRAEWPDVRPPDAFCAQVADQARGRLADWHPGWPHLWGHVLRVTGVAVALAEDQGLDPALAYLTGMCHDVAKLDEFRTGEPHEVAGADFAGQVLAGHFSPAQIASVQAAILKDGDGPLARLLYDADKLDKIGATGVVRRISTHTTRGWLQELLWRVDDDTQRFPAMHFDRSRALKKSKQQFGAWFLPLAHDVAGDV